MLLIARRLRNFFSLYEPVASSWRLYDSSVSEPPLVAARLSSQPVRVYDEKTWQSVTHQGKA